jgi:uncharacterized membrane-anchored protein YhcB (DUF1043 family)
MKIDIKMKTILLAFLTTLISFGALAQSESITTIDSLAKELLYKLDSVNIKQNQRISDINAQIQNTNARIDSLQQVILATGNALSQTEQTLGSQISATEKNTNQRISTVDQSLNKKSRDGIIWLLSVLLFSTILSVAIGLFLKKKQRADKTNIIEQLEKTKSSVEEKLVKEFAKQAEIMESLTKTLQTIPTATNAEPDHSLALKVADQLTSIERGINLIDEKTKGLQRIKNSLINLRDNLNANGYELPELIGKQFNQGMNIIVVNAISDENLKNGEEIITRIIKPQVNYKDKMIQAAQVEVSVGN